MASLRAVSRLASASGRARLPPQLLRATTSLAQRYGALPVPGPVPALSVAAAALSSDSTNNLGRRRQQQHRFQGQGASAALLLGGTVALGLGLAAATAGPAAMDDGSSKQAEAKAHAGLAKVKTLASSVLSGSSKECGAAAAHAVRYAATHPAEAVAPAVVKITVETLKPVPFKASVRGRCMGSGFVISEDGLVVTNAHVVENATNIVVKMNDGREFKATVQGADDAHDVAVLELDTQGAKLPVAPMGQSSAVRQGEWIMAMGSPRGLTNSVTHGIVSSLNRSKKGAAADGLLIQMDAAINAGNSGGPLVNLDGQVVGINALSLKDAEGVHFAIPIDLARQVTRQLLRVRRRLGLAARFVETGDTAADDDDEAATTGSPPFTMPRVLVVLAVQPGSPAAAAGLQAGDVVAAVGAEPLKDLGDFLDRLGKEEGEGEGEKEKEKEKGSVDFVVARTVMGVLPVDMTAAAAASGTAVTTGAEPPSSPPPQREG